ncbi:MAG: ATP-binding protein [Candidatus Marinimicrobia bacterium]|nr:ATP-binding protein [Candidatus Neomarinimicrobiota bacterium]
MIEQELQRKIQDFRELGIPEYVPREGGIHLLDRMVSTVIGARRSGKSFRVLQVADEMIRQGTLPSLDHVCPVDFDNPILAHMAAADLMLIQKTFLKLTPAFGLKTPLLFVFDEIHRISGWEEYVIDLSRNVQWKVIVTGSSSKLLKDDIATALRGKSVSSAVYPLSFAEYLRFRDFREKPTSTKGQAVIRSLFDDYLKWGGYPALPTAPEFSREALLREYFDTMILKDIVQRFNVSKPRQCTHLYNNLLSNIGRPYTLKSAYEFLKQSGYATSRDAVRDYVAWAEDAWLFFTLPIHSQSSKEQERNYRKLYCIDWSLAIHNSLVWDGSYSRALENMVYLRLRRKYPRVRYYLTRSKRQELDFLVSDDHGKSVMAVQVCMSMAHQATLKRECEPLIATAKYFGTKDNLIITLDEEQRIEQDGITIHVVPAWKWSLEQA